MYILLNNSYQSIFLSCSTTSKTAVITEFCLFHFGPGVVKSGLPRSQSESATGFSGCSRRHGRSREEQRRHTISSGVDYGLVGIYKHTTPHQVPHLGFSEKLFFFWKANSWMSLMQFCFDNRLNRQYLIFIV